MQPHPSQRTHGRLPVPSGPGRAATVLEWLAVGPCPCRQRCVLGPRAGQRCWGACVGRVRSPLLGARGKDALRTLSSWGRSLTVTCLLPCDRQASEPRRAPGAAWGTLPGTRHKSSSASSRRPSERLDHVTAQRDHALQGCSWWELGSSHRSTVSALRAALPGRPGWEATAPDAAQSGAPTGPVSFPAGLPGPALPSCLPAVLRGRTCQP